MVRPGAFILRMGCNADLHALSLRTKSGVFWRSLRQLYDKYKFTIVICKFVPESATHPR